MIEGSGADATQPGMCQQWSLVSLKHTSVNLGFSFRTAQQDSSDKYSTADLLFFSLIRQLSSLEFGAGCTAGRGVFYFDPTA